MTSCKKCGSTELRTQPNGCHTDLICAKCGAWVKFANKDEARLYGQATGTRYNSQVGGGEFHIQFETTNRAHYERVQKVIRDCIDEQPKIIAIDYDGTIALNSYPQAGDPNWPIIEKAKAEKAAGSKLILWTCREGEELSIALMACDKWGLQFDAINDNLPEMKKAWGDNPRKVFANEYWDDRSVEV